MAKVKLQNFRDHDIHIHIDKTKLVVPAADKNADGKKVPGIAECDDKFLAQMKRLDSVMSYFDEGALKASGVKEEEKKEDEKK